MELATAFYENDFSYEELKNERFNQWLATPISPLYCESRSVDVWNHLYTIKGSLMFKPRRYIVKAFPELLHISSDTHLVDFGSGNGASLFPLLSFQPKLHVVAVDLSPQALHYLSGHEQVTTLCLDISTVLLPSPMLEKNFDFALLIFTLSAIHPSKHVSSLLTCSRALKSGGRLLFRDYGMLDMIQLRNNERIGEFTVRKQDGVLCTFFTPEYLEHAFTQAGLVCEEPPRYCCVKNVNRKTGQELKRVFIRAVCRKV